MSAKPKITIIRLANAAAGEPYKVEAFTGLAQDAANAQAATWWGSGGTLALVVQIDGKEDSRYERDYLDTKRIPKGWPAKEQPVRKRPIDEILNEKPKPSAETKPVDPPTEKIKPAVERAQPTVFNVEDVPTPHKPPPVAMHPAAKGAPPNSVYLCWTCKGPNTGTHDLDAKPWDRTPSGRLNAGRCPECGAPVPMLTRRALYMTYLHAQHDKAIAEQSQHVIGAETLHGK